MQGEALSHQAILAEASTASTIQNVLHSFELVQSPLSIFAKGFVKSSFLDSARQAISARTLAANSSRLSRIATATADDEVVDAIDEANSWVATRAPAPKFSQADRVAFLTLVLMLLIFLYQKIDSEKATELILQRIASSETRLVDALQTISADSVPSKFVTVSRRVQLHVKPTAASRSLRQILPGTPLELRARRKNWIQVNVFNLEKGTSELGWVYRRFVSDLVAPVE